MRKKQYAFVIELDRCVGCKGCHVSCKMENGVPLGFNRIKVHQVGPIGVYPDLQMYFLPMMCQQCENPICVRVCPTGAIYKNEKDGVVILDKEKCIGCQSCNSECPYHANTFSKVHNYMDKCTLCIQNREVGERPACVKSCSGKALHYGDILDPESEVSKLLAEAGEDNVYTMENFGNNPSTRYILKNAEWQAILPYQLEEAPAGKGGKK